MNVNIFAQQIQALHWRLAKLYQGNSAELLAQPNLLLPIAFKELGTASEELQVAAEELYQQAEILAATRTEIEAERQRYQDLFEFMPNAYLVTDIQGKILEANRATGTLLNVNPSFLINKLLINFIPLQGRQAFRSQLAQLQLSNWVQELSLRLQPRNHESFDAALTVTSVCDSTTHQVTLRWIVRDITERQRALKALKSQEYDPTEDRSLHFYTKGELISLEPQSICLVRHGLVKLSTMSERGEEVLVGLIGQSMPFGSSMTALSTYQAVVLSETAQVVSIPLTEICDSVRLTQVLLPKFNQRLQQTESLLAISGKRQVKERLEYFLLFLKQEIGQPIAQGIRLPVRLTHQDIADACCTTRVTITRLMGKLQRQEEVSFDAKHQMIFKD
jgi:PAS domain S-box-containing protein